MDARAGGQAVGGSVSRGWRLGFKAESGGVHCRARHAGRPRAEPQPGDQLGERRRFGRGLRLAAGVAGSRCGCSKLTCVQPTWPNELGWPPKQATTASYTINDW